MGGDGVTEDLYGRAPRMESKRGSPWKAHRVARFSSLVSPFFCNFRRPPRDRFVDRLLSRTFSEPRTLRTNAEWTTTCKSCNGSWMEIGTRVAASSPQGLAMVGRGLCQATPKLRLRVPPTGHVVGLSQFCRASYDFNGIRRITKKGQNRNQTVTRRRHSMRMRNRRRAMWFIKSVKTRSLRKGVGFRRVLTQ